MNASQKKAYQEQLQAVLEEVQQEVPSDQILHRVSAARKEGDRMYWDVEVRVINADDDYDSGWYWVNNLSVGPRGRAL